MRHLLEGPTTKQGRVIGGLAGDTSGHWADRRLGDCRTGDMWRPTSFFGGVKALASAFHLVEWEWRRKGRVRERNRSGIGLGDLQ
jgi:hypothetical protein